MKAKDLAQSFPKSIKLPEELKELCKWRDKNWLSAIQMRMHEDDTLQCWFGTGKAIGDLAHFGSGPDGSLFCLWRQDDGRLPIVHMGSEGTHNLVVAETALDFLRLLAIGYREIGFADLNAPPRDDADEDTLKFRTWLAKKFGGEIPAKGSEITMPAQKKFGDFQKWIKPRCG